MPTPTCPHCQAPLPPSGTTCPQCGEYVPGWLFRDGSAHGPYDWETLELLFHQGRLRPDDRVTWDPEGNWLTPAEAFSAPTPLLAPPRVALPVTSAAALPLPPQPAARPALAPPGATPAPASSAAAPGGAPRRPRLTLLLAGLIFLAGTAVGTFLIGQRVGFVQEARDQEQCAGQLKLIALGMRMYALDYDALPPGNNWPVALAARGVPRRTWLCPSRHDGIPYPVAPQLDLHRLQAGDRSLALAADAPLRNGSGPHHGKFNVVYADGHVAQAAHSPLPGGKGSVVAQLPGGPASQRSGLGGPASGVR